MKLIKKMRYGIAKLLNRHPCALINTQIHSTASVGNGAQLVDCTMGRYSYLYGSNAVKTHIGAFCSIAPGCSIGGGSHPVDWVSTSPVFYRGKNVLRKNFSNNQYQEYQITEIGNDVWIGAKCMIKGGISIGDGAVIGMGSVVTHDVPPYEIWAGNPARCIRKRFDDDTIEQLLQSKWWEWSDDVLACVGDDFSDPQQMINHFKENIK